MKKREVGGKRRWEVGGKGRWEKGREGGENLLSSPRFLSAAAQNVLN